MLGPLGNTSMSESSTLVRALLMILLVSGTLIVIMSNFFRAGLTCRPEVSGTEYSRELLMAVSS
jgi:hypothetical protein